MNSDALQNLVNRWHQGDIAWSDFEAALRATFSSTIPTGDVLVDLERAKRCGHPEVVFGPGKSPQAVLDVFDAQIAAGQNSLATRVTADQAVRVLEKHPDARWNQLARTLTLTRIPIDSRGRIIVATAGTSDRPVAEEALETALWMGCQAELINDIGVAGPQRLLAQRERLSQADAIVVVAGMEGALPSVVAGWVAVPVIGVPTSVGYGANFGGFAALLSMLNSCAANVAVVNIDAGFKGGYLAAIIALNAASAMNAE